MDIKDQCFNVGNIKKNFIYNSLYQLLIIMIPLITTPYLSRVLGAKNTGVYSYSYAIATYFVLFIMLGLNNYGNRTIASIRYDNKILSKEFWSVYALQLICGLIATFVYVCYTILFSNNIMTWILLIYVISGIIDINWFFFGMEQFKITVTRNTVIKIISTLLIFLLVKDSGDVYIYALISVMGTIIGQCVLWVYLARFVHMEKIGIGDIVKHIKPNLILFIPVIAISLYKYMDKIMLGALSSMSEVGYYDYSERVIQVPMALINSLGTVMLPKMSNVISKGERERADRYMLDSVIFVIAIVSIVCFGLMGVSDIFVPIFLGNNYYICIILFNILLPSCLFLGVANVIRTQYLIPMKRDKEYIISVFLGSIVNFVINYSLISGKGSVGAAIGTLFAEMTVCVYQVYSVKEEVKIFKMIKMASPFLVAGIVMYVVLIHITFSTKSIVSLFIKIVIGAILYIISLFVFYIFSKNNSIGKNLKNLLLSATKRD